MAEKKLTVEELIKRSEKPGRDAMKLHPFYQGKIQVTSKCVVRNLNDFAIWYTPGVAKPCMDIKENPLSVYEHTNKGNCVAIISDGTRVLGLGNIGPEAAIPVMEGKSLLFKYLGGVDAFPICLDARAPEKFIEIVLALQPCLGGVNLEDIEQPKCYHILDELRKHAHIPIWHDDQQGTAAVTLAGLINAIKVVNKKKEDVKIAMIGAGAANIATLRMMLVYGFLPENVMLTDIYGIVEKNRKDFEKHFPYESLRKLLDRTNSEHKQCDNTEKATEITLKDADVAICYSRPGPGTVKPEWVSKMAKDAIIFACANPIPEIWPWDARKAGAKIVATGRSDFANQVNNSLGFPGIFRGVLDIRATTITDEMCLAAAVELARVAEDKGLHEEYIIPTMEEWDVFPREAVAVALKAIEQGVAQVKRTKAELTRMAENKIRNARESIQLLMKNEYIPPAPPDEKS